MPNYVDALGDAVRGAIRAFHGSALPEHFDKLDASKIGTGEGAQSYGYGHYSAQKQAVADEYRRALSYRKLREDYGRVLPDNAEADEVLAALQEFDPRQRAFLKELAANDWLGFDYPSQAIGQSLGRQAGFSGYDVSASARDARSQLGTGYELEIRHPESSLLDYDATLQNQPEHVRSILPSLNLPLEDATPPTLKAVYGIEKPTNITGREIQIALNRNEMAHRGAEWAQREAAAARTFADAGIPGVRYLDQGSRNTGPSGTRNYVMFPGTEDSIRILRKYGIGGAAAGAAMSDEEQY